MSTVTRFLFALTALFVWSSAMASQFTLVCDTRATGKDQHATSDGDKVRLKGGPKYFTIDTDQKRYSDGTEVYDLKNVTDKSIDLIDSEHGAFMHWETIDRITGSYQYFNSYMNSKGDGWYVDITGDCHKVALRPMPTPKF
jgi:hypothetical protein